MKPLLTLALIACTATGANAQSTATDNTHGFSIGINAGACWNTKPFNSFRFDKPGKPGPSAELGLYYRFDKHWEAGLAISYKRLSIGREGDDWDENSFNPATGQLNPGAQPIHVAFTSYYPAFTAKAVGNYHFSLEKIDAYAGLSMGYTTVSKADGNTEVWSGKRTTAYSPGVQLGACYPLTRHLAVNLQLGAEAILLFTHPNWFDMLAASGLAGIRYRF